MKLVIIEPLGVEKQTLLAMADKILPKSVEVVYYDTKVTDTESLIARGKDADVIVLANLPFGNEVIRGCEKLKMLSVAFTGVDHIGLDACRERNILVSNCAGYSTAAVADLVFGMVISLYRNIIPCDKAVREGGTKDGLIGYELEGKTFGVAGTGAIGTRVAKIADSFGCKVLGYNRSKKDIDYIEFVDKETLLKNSDIISLHMPLTDETRNFIGKKELDMMKPSALLINTARGPIVDYTALADALNSGRIAGAGVDVYETEPPLEKGHPILNAKNVIATPHIGFATKERLIKRAAIVFDNVTKWTEKAPQNVIK
jgi:phosphoglycerate dehydrogenase-like enzyme